MHCSQKVFFSWLLSRCSKTSSHSQTCTLQEHHINTHMGFKAAAIHFSLVIAVFLRFLTHKHAHAYSLTSQHKHTHTSIHRFVRAPST